MKKQNQGALFVVSGPSGVGKTTVVTEFLRQYQDQYHIKRAITYTTKHPRSTEAHGIDYHFVAQAEFERKVADNFFLEWSGEYGACYGTPSSILNDIAQGVSYILVIDRVGAEQILKKYPDVILIWLYVSSVDILSERLNQRKTETLQVIQKRLALAEKEINQELFVPLYDYHVANDDLSSAVHVIADIILPRIFLLQSDIK